MIQPVYSPRGTQGRWRCYRLFVPSSCSSFQRAHIISISLYLNLYRDRKPVFLLSYSYVGYLISFAVLRCLVKSLVNCTIYASWEAYHSCSMLQPRVCMLAIPLACSRLRRSPGGLYWWQMREAHLPP